MSRCAIWWECMNTMCCKPGMSCEVREGEKRLALLCIGVKRQESYGVCTELQTRAAATIPP